MQAPDLIHTQPPFKHAALVAVIFEFLGAITAGGRVSKTIQKGILTASKFKGKEGLMQVGFVCALIGSSSWLQFANYFALPVSTTHSIIGAVIGIGVAAFGADAIQWGFANPQKLNGKEYISTDGFGPIAISWVSAQPALTIRPEFASQRNACRSSQEWLQASLDAYSSP
jgi:phosphate/sulfate permease